jgi:hypothetical protein
MDVTGYLGLVEYNTVTIAGCTGFLGNSCYVKVNGRHNIFRFNQLIDDDQVPTQEQELLDMGWMESEYNKVYHNLLYGGNNGPSVSLNHLSRRDTLPPELHGEVLFSGDVDQVLTSNVWNPSGRPVGAEERTELSRLLADYRYFARLSKVERLNLLIKPQLDRLREAGAYVEFPDREAPPVPEGVRIAHVESSDKSGFKRVYCFPAEDYPDIAHQERVERERGLETFLAVYDLINPP